MQKIRNVAIIAHVDHGKTTLTDKIIYQSNLFRENQEQKELLLDSNDLERERGITIFSKNISVFYKDHKINIIDTPGHADFGGEVERVLNMADGVLLLVDAFEGPMPQTRFVLQKAIEMGLKLIVVINKVDKDNCRPDVVQEEIFELMYNLGATDEQLDFPTVYGSSKQGWMSNHWKNKTDNIYYLLDTIIASIPAPKYVEGTLQMLISSMEYSSYVGRIAIGKVKRGIIKQGQLVAIVKRDGSIIKSKVNELYVFEGLGKNKKNEVVCGEICAVTGLEGFEISDTLADIENPEPLPPIPIDEPTMSMLFTINDSPFFGKEGKFVTSQKLKERLFKETEKNLALRVKETESADKFVVYGRGVLHLSILIETMRREGYEFQVGKPIVLTKNINGTIYEPIEELTIDTPDAVAGKVIELINKRKGELISMTPKGDMQRLVFYVPARGLIGYRTPLMNITSGEAISASRFKGYEPWKGDISGRSNGVLVAMETGTVIAYALDKLQDRGFFFVDVGEQVYQGQIVGEYTRNEDLVVNVSKTKKLTNMRASGSDEKVKIAPPVIKSLEECLEYIQDDEYVEITPKNIRMRKIVLDEIERKKMKKNTNAV
ncbi:MAG: translational GTPase TypA [Bacteroidales bacterium]|nr:translational GTPase TypA [Bacteroidales bacterium]